MQIEQIKAWGDVLVNVAAMLVVPPTLAWMFIAFNSAVFHKKD